MPSLKIRSETIIASTTPIVNSKAFGNTLGDKIILAAVGSVITALNSYIFMCIFKWIRNDGHLKVSNSIIFVRCGYVVYFLEELVYT